MNPKEYVLKVLDGQVFSPNDDVVSAYAPSNIALCKYWGKRDPELNLPVTSSLSVSLAQMGTTTVLKRIDAMQDRVVYNQSCLDLETSFAQRIVDFLDFFRQEKKVYFEINTQNTLPQSAGFASSASGYAALIQAINLICDWHLDDRRLSLLARLGSGSACRSLWHGFVEWQMGEQDDGMDSYSHMLAEKWPDFCMGLVLISDQQKPIGSRKAMQITQQTSPYYSIWPSQVDKDLCLIKEAIQAKQFTLLGETAERNALSMHALMQTATPTISYCLPETTQLMRQVWALRDKGIEVYFTQDAGPNIKLIFMKESLSSLQQHFPNMMVVEPFSEFIEHD